MSTITDIEEFIAQVQAAVTVSPQGMTVDRLRLAEIFRAVRFPATGMYNCCYNLSQREGKPLTESDCKSMREACDRWDGKL